MSSIYLVFLEKPKVRRTYKKENEDGDEAEEKEGGGAGGRLDIKQST